jgi:predicted metal-dependent phosphoesterase TrpH
MAVLAHPQSISREQSELMAIITDMAGKGLDGLEVYNGLGLEGDERFLLTICSSLGLMVTGGSDFHGDDESIVMGRVRGNLLTDELFKHMKTRCETYKKALRCNAGLL